MKKLLTLVFICASIFGYAQNFLVTNDQGIEYANGETIAATITEDDLTHKEYIVTVFLINPTESSITMNTLRTNIELPEKVSAYVCCLEGCYGDDVFAISGTIEEKKHDDYALHLRPNGGFGMCKFKLEFWTEENKADIFTLYVEINILGVGVKENKHGNSSLSAFPNPAPAHSNININYALAEKSQNNRLIIRNILGCEVMNIPLNPHQNSISLDISPLVSGVYFYAIENKNHISIVKKLIINN